MDNQSKSFFALILGLLMTASGHAQQDLLSNSLAPAQQAAIASNEKQGFSIYPASIASSASLLINAERADWSILEIKDVCGKTLLSQQMAVDKGFNKIPIFFVSQLDPGTHTAVLKVEEHTYFSQVIKK